MVAGDWCKLVTILIIEKIIEEDDILMELLMSLVLVGLFFYVVVFGIKKQLKNRKEMRQLQARLRLLDAKMEHLMSRTDELIEVNGSSVN